MEDRFEKRKSWIIIKVAIIALNLEGLGPLLYKQFRMLES